MTSSDSGPNRTDEQQAVGERVLIVEDERLTARMLADVVEELGYEVHTARDAEAARATMAEVGIGIALVDYHLPGSSGVELIRTLTVDHPYLRAIVMSARPTQEMAVEALRVGAVDYLSKPISADLLAEKLKIAARAYGLSVERDNLVARYRTLFETIPGVACFVSRDGTFQQMNTAGASLLGYPTDYFTGRSYEDVLSAAERPEDVEWVFCERRTGARATSRRVVRLRTAGGEERLFELSTTGYYARHADGTRRQLGTIGVGWDATEHLRLQEQLRHSQKMEAVGRLAGGVAHDFNNLLTVINGNAQLIRHRLGRDHELALEVADVEAAGERAAELTKRLLMFSRRNLVTSEPVSIRKVVDGVQRMLEHVIGEDIQVHLDVTDDPDVVMADAAQLEQVLVNLAVNGRDAMPDGGKLTLRTRTTVVEPGFLHASPDLAVGEYVVVQVIDTGVGMSQDVREHVFEPFFTTKGPESGTGLGLSIVYGIVHQHGGTVEIESAPGAGAKVTIMLPRVAEPERTARRRAETVFETGGETVLVVEDEGMVRRLLCRSLEFQNYRVLEAADGNGALELLRAHAAADTPVPLLVTDMVMPGMGGAELARTARAEHPQLRVLYMSGYVGEAVSGEDMLSAGARFIEKPITAARFLTEVRSLLDERWKLPEKQGE